MLNVTHSTEVNYDKLNSPVSLNNTFDQNFVPKIQLYSSAWVTPQETLFTSSSVDFKKSLSPAYTTKRYITSSEIVNNFFAKLDVQSKFETDVLDDLDESAENLRTKSSNFPVKLIKGVLNNHNVLILNSSETLSKNIFLSYRINNSNITEKISQIEQF